MEGVIVQSTADQHILWNWYLHVDDDIYTRVCYLETQVEVYCFYDTVHSDIVDLYDVPCLWIYTICISDHVHHAVLNGTVVYRYTIPTARVGRRSFPLLDFFSFLRYLRLSMPTVS